MDGSRDDTARQTLENESQCPPRQTAEDILRHKDMEDIPRHKDFTRSQLGDVSAFLCNFLEVSGITPKQVLRAAGLPTADLHHAFALQALYEAASPYMPATVVSDTVSDAQSEDYD